MIGRGTICLAASLVAGCTSGSLNNALGTPKNPTPVFADPGPDAKFKDDQTVFLVADYGVLLEAINFDTKPIKTRPVPPGYDMRRYLAAGFNLANGYCTRFLNKTDEAYRRRGYARSLGNDVGTAVTTILGLANAGEAAVSALAAATGVADSALRNYDNSFLITPELSTVRGLVSAAQANYRARTLGPSAILPADFGTAQSAIREYAELCSFQSMKGMLTVSAQEQEKDLKADTKDRIASATSHTKPPVEGSGTKVDAKSNDPVLASPALAPNVPSP